MANKNEFHSLKRIIVGFHAKDRTNKWLEYLRTQELDHILHQCSFFYFAYIYLVGGYDVPRTNNLATAPKWQLAEKETLDILGM